MARAAIVICEDWQRSVIRHHAAAKWEAVLSSFLVDASQLLSLSARTQPVRPAPTLSGRLIFMFDLNEAEMPGSRVIHLIVDLHPQRPWTPVWFSSG